MANRIAHDVDDAWAEAYLRRTRQWPVPRPNEEWFEDEWAALTPTRKALHALDGADWARFRGAWQRHCHRRRTPSPRVKQAKAKLDHATEILELREELGRAYAEIGRLNEALIAAGDEIARLRKEQGDT